MSPESQGVRHRITVRTSPRRAPEEHIAIHAPWLFRAARRAIGRMAPHSPLRRAILPRSISIAQAAYNRRDWSAAVPGYDPEAEVIPPRQWSEMGDFDPVYRGREGLVRYYRQWIESWPNIRVEPQEIIDFGERVFLRGQTSAAGAVSGIELTGPYFQLFEVRDGLVTRDQTFLDDSEALEAAGLWNRPMSAENAGVLRRWFWAFGNDTEAFREALHPLIEWYPIEEDNTPNLGIEAAMRNRNEWLETWDSHRIDWEVVAEEGENVVVRVHLTGQGKASGVETDVCFYAHFKVRDGKVAYIYDHRDREAAIEAAGLAE